MTPLPVVAAVCFAAGVATTLTILLIYRDTLVERAMDRRQEEIFAPVLTRERQRATTPPPAAAAPVRPAAPQPTIWAHRCPSAVPSPGPRGEQTHRLRTGWIGPIAPAQIRLDAFPLPNEQRGVPDGADQ